jgi:hypothetical protein
MNYLTSIGAIAVATALCVAGARAHDESKYPDLKGQWGRPAAGPAGTQWDPTKPPGAGQQAPLTAEYKAKYDEHLAKAAAGRAPGETCLPPGMPRSMIAYEPLEIIVMPDTTYIMLSYMSEFRRIYTDGRKFPDDVEPSFAGYSVGEWKDTDNDGRFDTLEVETRGMKGPRTFDSSGIPLHDDNESVIKEKIYLDKTNPNLLHDEVTTMDHALTRPWTVTRDYRRDPNGEWLEFVCAETNHNVLIGEETYTLSEEGYLMPTRPGQPGPDLRYFPNRR